MAESVIGSEVRTHRSVGSVMRAIRAFVFGLAHLIALSDANASQPKRPDGSGGGSCGSYLSSPGSMWGGLLAFVGILIFGGPLVALRHPSPGSTCI